MLKSGFNLFSLTFFSPQVFLLVSTILTPATIVMVIANAIHTVLGYSMGICTFFSALPALSLIVLGFTIKPDNQVIVAAALCTCYALVMASVRGLSTT